MTRYTHVSQRRYQVTGKIRSLKRLPNSTEGNPRWLISIMPDSGPLLVYQTQHNISDAYILSGHHVGHTATLTIDNMQVTNIELMEEQP